MLSNKSNIQLSAADSISVAVKSDLYNTFLTSAIPLIGPYVLHLVEKFSSFQWYELSDEEKEQMFLHYNSSRFYRCCKLIEDNIGYIKDGVFVIKVSATMLCQGIILSGCGDDAECMSSWQNIQNTFSKYAMYPYLGTFIFYDVIGMFIKRYYRKACMNKKFVRNESHDSGLGEISIHSQSSSDNTNGFSLDPFASSSRSIGTQVDSTNFNNDCVIEITSRQRVNNIEIAAYNHIDRSNMVLRRRHTMPSLGKRRNF